MESAFSSTSPDNRNASVYTVSGVMAQPDTSSSSPVVLSKCNADDLQKIDKMVRQLFNENKRKMKLSESWPDDLIKLATNAIAYRNAEAMLALARRLKDDLKLKVPTIGAFWSDPAVGQEKAKQALLASGGGGQVLSQTDLGALGQKSKLTPQRPKMQKGTDAYDETLEEFYDRNRSAILWWGALSALYAEGLTGEVHVWLPKGLTMSSIFWNDELPVLHQLKRDGKITDLHFHVQGHSGVWSGNLRFDQLTIVDVYLCDARGVNKGAQQLLAETDPALKGTLKPKEYHMELATPIRINLLQAGFRRALERARGRIAERERLASTGAKDAM